MGEKASKEKTSFRDKKGRTGSIFKTWPEWGGVNPGIHLQTNCVRDQLKNVPPVIAAGG